MGARGDVNDDGEECTLGDVSSLIGHIFIDGAELNCMAEANLNADQDGELSLGNISYGVDHLFISQRPLISCTEVKAAPTAKLADARATLYQSARHDTTSLYLSTRMMLRGVQVTLTGERKSTASKIAELGLDLFQGWCGDTLKVGLLDLDGAGVIDMGDWSLVRIPGTFEVLEASAADMGHNKVILAVKEGNPNLPTWFELAQNYPNPFNPSTTIEFALPQSLRVSLTVFNILGQTVDVLLDSDLPAGYHEVDWNAGKYASGVYFYRLKAGSFIETRKMLLLK